MGERLLCKQEVAGSIPAGSIAERRWKRAGLRSTGHRRAHSPTPLDGLFDGLNLIAEHSNRGPDDPEIDRIESPWASGFPACPGTARHHRDGRPQTGSASYVNHPSRRARWVQWLRSPPWSGELAPSSECRGTLLHALAYLGPSDGTRYSRPTGRPRRLATCSSMARGRALSRARFITCAHHGDAPPSWMRVYSVGELEGLGVRGGTRASASCRSGPRVTPQLGDLLGRDGRTARTCQSVNTSFGPQGPPVRMLRPKTTASAVLLHATIDRAKMGAPPISAMMDELLVDIDQRARVFVQGAASATALLGHRRCAFRSPPGLSRGRTSRSCAGIKGCLRAAYGADGARGLRIAEALRALGPVGLRLGVRGGRGARRVPPSSRRLRTAGGRHPIVLDRRAGPPLGADARSRASIADRAGPGWHQPCPRGRAAARNRGRRERRAGPDGHLSPAGRRDVGYRMVARPLLQRLQAVRGGVELTVLRPPTFAALRERLRPPERPERPFRSSTSMVMARSPVAGPPEEGTDLAELERRRGHAGVQEADRRIRPGGGLRRVARPQRGEHCLVVLNACQSGAVGKELEAAVATDYFRRACRRSSRWRTRSMRSRPPTSWGRYQRLFIGESVTEAVTAGRRHLFEHCLRPSPKGELELADWVIPVHYRRHDMCFPQLVARRVAQRPDTRGKTV